MKIGILTFHRAINYGAVLQCFALSETLRNRGHDVEVIDFRPPYIEKYRKFFNFYNVHGIRVIKEIAKAFVIGGDKKKAIKNFDGFISKLKLSPIVYDSDDIAALHYDIILCGSDQVWNKRITGGRFEKIYWGQFEHLNCKFATYAASFGKLNRTPELEETIRKMLLHIDAISVREADFASYLKDIGFDATVCVDPTILANRQLFIDMADEPQIEKYILVYALKDRGRIIEWARKIQKQTKQEIVVLGGNASYKTKKQELGVTVVQGVSPQQYLGYFKKASYVVNASFHGTVFSTIFRKDFYSVNVENSGRYEQYLRKVGLSDRFVNLDSNPSLIPVDYSNFEKSLTVLLEETEFYLNSLGL